MAEITMKEAVEDKERCGYLMLNPITMEVFCGFGKGTPQKIKYKHPKCPHYTREEINPFSRKPVKKEE